MLFAVAEERLDRIKQSRVWPTLAIEECLSKAGYTWDDIDEVAIGWNPGIDAETAPAGFTNGRRWRSEHLQQVPTRLIKQSGRPAHQVIGMENLWDKGPRITYVDHYMAHVGNAFYLSPYDECAVAVLDGLDRAVAAGDRSLAGGQVDLAFGAAGEHAPGIAEVEAGPAAHVGSVAGLAGIDGTVAAEPVCLVVGRAAGHRDGGGEKRAG